MSNPVLSVNHVYKNYTSGTETIPILSDLSLVVDMPQAIAITGESGCGKSTLLNIIGAMENADAGSICVGDYAIDGLSEAKMTEYRTKEVGLIFQFHYLLKDFTALENIMLPALIAGLDARSAEEKARALINEVHLSHRMHHLPHQLSGGERQRIATARALINDPTLILADEPTGNLDPHNASVVQELLFLLTEKHHKTLIIVTHDMHIADLAEKTYRLEKGQLWHVHSN